LVLETSGLADPGRIVDAIRTDPILVHHIVVGETIVAVDALYGLDQLRSEPLARCQIEIADRLVLTKLDEVRAEVLPGLCATLSRLNPGAALCAAVRGSPAPLPDFSGASAENITYANAGNAPILATKLVLDHTIDWPAFSVWLSALLHARGDDVVRVKGAVRTPGGRLLVQTVRRAVQSPELIPDHDWKDDRDTIVVIGRGFSAEDLGTSLRRFAGIVP
jgi:G3E family GTPase